MDDLGTSLAAVPTVPAGGNVAAGGPGTPKPTTPTLDDLEKLYVKPQAPARPAGTPSLSDLEKMYAPEGGSGNIDLGADQPRKNQPSATPQGTDQGTGFVDQVKAFGRNLTTSAGRAKLGMGLYHGIVDPLATVGMEAQGPVGYAQEVADQAANPKPSQWMPKAATDPVGMIAAPLVVAASALPIGEAAGAVAKAGLERVAPAAAERVAEILGSAGAKGAAARLAAGSAESAVHGAAIGAAADPTHPVTGAELGAAGGVVLHGAGRVAGEIASDVAGDAKSKIGGYRLRKEDEALNPRRTGTNYYPEERAGRLIPAESGQAPPPLPPKVQVTPHVTQDAPAGPDFEVEQNQGPMPPAPQAPGTPKANPPENTSGINPGINRATNDVPPVKLLPPGRPGTPEGATGTPPVELPHDDALSYMDDRIKHLLTQRDEAQRAANVNPLTGLPNKAAWERALPNAEAHPRMSILRGDINGMKNAQDAVGSHAEGDKIIQGAASAMQQAAAQIPGARVFHPSGDEFAAIVPTEHAQAFQQAAEQAYGVRDHGQGARTSLSLGIGKTDAEADAATYARKAIQKQAQGIANRKPAPEGPALPPSAPPTATNGAEATLSPPRVPDALEPVAGRIGAGTDKSVRDVSSQAKVKGDTITLTHRMARMVMDNGPHQIPLASWPSHALDQRALLLRYMGADPADVEPQQERIADSGANAIDKALMAAGYEKRPARVLNGLESITRPLAPAKRPAVSWDPAAWRARYGAQLGRLSDPELTDALSKLEANRAAAGHGTQADELIHRDILNVRNELAGRERARATRREGPPPTTYEQSLLKMDRPKLEAELARHETELDAGLGNEDGDTARRVVEIARKRLAEMDAEQKALPAGQHPAAGMTAAEFRQRVTIRRSGRDSHVHYPNGERWLVPGATGPAKVAAIEFEHFKRRPAEVARHQLTPRSVETAGAPTLDDLEKKFAPPAEGNAPAKLEPRAELEKEHAALLAELRKPKLSRMDRRTAIQQIDYVRQQLRAHGVELSPLAHERPAKPKGPPALPEDIARKPKLSEDNLEQSARYDDDRFRPYHTVSTHALVDEIADLQDRIAARGSQTELRTADERGEAIQVTTKSRGGRPSVQAQARKNIADWNTRIEHITEHLKRARGLSQEEIDELNAQAHIDRYDQAQRPGDDLDSIPFETGPLYHGTHGVFPASKLKAARGDLGIHFGTKEQAEERLAFHRRNGIKGWSSGPRTIQAMLGIDNPLRTDDAGNWKNVQSVQETIANALDLHPEDLREYTTMAELRKFLEGQGYDGIVYSNEHEIPGLQDALEAQRRAQLAWSVAREAERPDAAALRAKFMAAQDRRTRLIKEGAADSYIAFRPKQVIGAVGEQGAHYRAQLAERASQVEPAMRESMTATFGSPEKALAAADKVVAMMGDQATVTYAKPAQGLPSVTDRISNVQKALRRQAVLLASFEPIGKHVPDAAAVAKLFRVARDPLMEHLQAGGLNDENRIVHYERWSSGAINFVRPPAGFANILHQRLTEAGATQLVLSHNHPSGDPTPSQPDLAYTKKLQAELNAIAERRGEKPITIREHVVIDHKHYAVIRLRPRSPVSDIVSGGTQEPGGAFEVSTDLAVMPQGQIEASDWTDAHGTTAIDADDIHAIAAANLRDSEGFDVLHLNYQHQIVADQFFPAALATHPGLAERLVYDGDKMGAPVQVIVVHARDRADSDLFYELSRRMTLANRAGLTQVLDVIRIHPDGFVSAGEMGILAGSAPGELHGYARQMAEPQPQLGMFGDEPAPAPSKKDQLGMFGENEGTKLAQDEAVKLRNKDQKIQAPELEQRRDELGAPKPAEPIQTGDDQGALFELPPGFGASFNRAFNPVAASDQAAHAGRIIRQRTGEQARQRAQIEELMRPVVRMFNKMPESARYDFMDRMESGRPQASPELNQVAKVFRKALDEAREAIQDLGTGKLRGFIEDYFPHIWQNPKKAAVFFGKRPLEGSKSFLKQRSIPTIKDGVAAGLKPVSTNPAELVTLKLFEMHKYIMASRIVQEHQAQGLAKWISTRKKPPEGWTQIKDPSAVKYGPPKVTVVHQEAFDAELRNQLASVIDALKLRHSRTVKSPDGSRINWGLAYQGGSRRMWTKMGGGPDVIIHELGHMIDFDHELWNKLVSTPAKRTTKGGKTVSADSKETIAERKKMIGQLRALADARYKGDPGPHFKAYVRNRREQMANAVHALVFAPELGERLAPDIMAKLRAHFESDPILRPLLHLERSVRLGSAGEPVEYDTGGIVVMAKFYAPDPVARVLNNYLSPGLRGSPYYNAYMGVGNVLNAAQLSLSAFHLGFTSLDASVSKFALALEQIATGQPLNALKSFAKVPLAPITNVMRGNKVLRAYVRPGSMGAELAQIADHVAMAGGRGQMDDWYRTQQWRRMRDNMVEAVRGQGFGHRVGSAGAAALRALPAAMEVLAKPILEYIVPRQKLGVFADLAVHELGLLRRNGHTPTEDEVRAAMQRAWDSVDNRMGQMVYDNLFWNKIGKDLAHAGMRSVGWNIGTVRELGGAVADTKRLLERVIPDRDDEGQRRPPPPGKGARPGEQTFTHRMAYAMALPMVVGAIGAIVTYLSTGEGPKELYDYFYPRTGGKTPEGDDARIELPSYMKDILGFVRHPISTVEHKAMPLLSLISSMLENQDYYGNEIVDPESPAGKQVEQALAGIGKQFLPFSLQGALEQKARGGNRTEETLPLIGVTPAPKEVTRTEAQQKAYNAAQLRRKGIQTPDEAAASTRRFELEERERQGENIEGELRDMVRQGEISPADAARIRKAGRTSAEIRRFRSLTLDQAQDAFDAATPAERRVLGPILARKKATARARHSLKVGQQ